MPFHHLPIPCSMSAAFRRATWSAKARMPFPLRKGPTTTIGRSKSSTTARTQLTTHGRTKMARDERSAARHPPHRCNYRPLSRISRDHVRALRQSWKRSSFHCYKSTVIGAMIEVQETSSLAVATTWRKQRCIPRILLPTSIDRVYSPASAEAGPGWRSRYGFEQVLAQRERRSFEVLPAGSTNNIKSE